MNKAFILLLLMVVNLTSLAQSMSKYILLPLNEAQANGLVSAIEYYKIHYSSEIYGFSALEDGDNIMVIFDISPRPPPKKWQRGGGDKSVQVTYSKLHMKIVKSGFIYAK